ncbi:MAG TPA: homoserine kinase [Planctomycetota bacterium]|nr:homoserine kinase [Planctomycetota bacterium]
MALPRSQLHVRVHGSTSNLGPGFDCLGLAVELTLHVGVRPAEDPKIEGPTWKSKEGALAERPLEGEERVVRAMRALADRAGRRLPPVELTGRSDIPVARGLGSSGAATVAGLVAARAMLDLDVDDGALFDLATVLEGHPDNAGPALFGGCVVSMPRASGRVSWFSARLHPDLRLAAAWPARPLETGAARAVLPDTVPFRVARDQARRLAQLLRGLEDLDPERLAIGMDDELHTPHRLRLIPGCREALDAARGAGALGAAISGSGSAVVAIGNRPMEPVAAVMVSAFESVGESATGRALAIPTQGYSIEPLTR